MTMASGHSRRIVHAIAQLRFGAGRYVVDTAIEQHRRHPGSVSVVVGDDGEGPWVSSPALLGELSAQAIEVVRCGDLFRRDVRNLKASAELLRRTVGKWRPDAVVHAHTAMTALVARWAGAPTVVCSCHGWSAERPAAFDLQDAIAFSMCDAVTTPSTHWAGVLREKAGLNDVALVPYGFDLGRYPHRARPASSKGPIRIVCVGELTERKGPDVLLEAMTRLWEHHPEVELHFVGDGDWASEMRARARTIDAAGSRVVFHGQVTAPYERLDQFDLFALASRSDNQPVAIVEAMLAGLPVVSTRVGGIGELIDGGTCGHAVEPNAPAVFAEALRRVIAAGSEFRLAMGERGERFARRTFDVARHVDALDAVYRLRSQGGSCFVDPPERRVHKAGPGLRVVTRPS
jgi:glycosyltransferase involved in cell wall biosynthesis